MDPVLVTLGASVVFVEKNPKRRLDPSAPELVARAAIVQQVHEDPNPEGRADVCVFAPGGPVVVRDVPYEEGDAPETETAKAKKARVDDGRRAPALLVGTPGTWRWPPKS